MQQGGKARESLDASNFRNELKVLQNVRTILRMRGQLTSLPTKIG